MKKFISIIAICMLALTTFAACGDSGEFKLYKVKTSKYIKTLGEYRSLSVEAEKTEITDEILRYFYEYFFTSLASAGLTDYAASLGDTVVLDYSGSIDGVVFDGGTATGQYLTLGSHTFIDDFEDQLVGIKSGESRDVTVTFPDTYTNDELAGKEAVFACTVSTVVPAYSEENLIAINNPNFTSAAEYEKYVKDYVTSMAESEYKESVVGGALTQIEAATVFKNIPEEVAEYERQSIISAYTAYATQYSMSVDDYLKQSGTSLDAMVDKYAKRQLICQEIANRENLNVTDEEVNASAAETVAASASYESAEAFLEEQGFENYRNYLMCEKVYDYLMSVTLIQEPVGDLDKTDGADSSASSSEE